MQDQYGEQNQIWGFFSFSTPLEIFTTTSIWSSSTSIATVIMLGRWAL